MPLFCNEEVICFLVQCFSVTQSAYTQFGADFDIPNCKEIYPIGIIDNTNNRIIPKRDYIMQVFPKEPHRV